MSSTHATATMTALLAHREWVRRLARSLVRDDASAEDLAQTAWIDAMRSPPREASRSWLARVLRRRALDASRASERRAAHERGAARDERTRATADVVAEAETQRRVVEAVCALEEPYRTTVLLRFFEDLPPREVARRMGVPAETVRTRQRRAAGTLRRALGGGDGSEWLAALAPVLAAPPGSEPPLAAAGGIAMKVSSKAVAAALVLVVTGVLVWVAVEASRDETESAVAAGLPADPSAGSRTRAAYDSSAAARTPRNRIEDAGAAPTAAPPVATSHARADGSAAPATTPSADAHARFENEAVAVTSEPRPSGRTVPAPAPWSADELLELLAKPLEPAIPLNELADDAAAFARGFTRRREGPMVEALRMDPAAAVEDGTRIVFPAGCHRWDTTSLAGRTPFPQDLLVEGAGMDETLVVLGHHLVASGKVGVITFRDLTIHCDDDAFLRVGMNVVRLERVRVVGFDGDGAGRAPRLAVRAGELFSGQALALLAQDCRFESGFGNTPGRMMWFLGTSPVTTAASGWITLARFERCRFVGPFEKPIFSVFLTSSPAATVYSRCDLVGCTALDRELIEHPERTPSNWPATYVRFEDCRVTYAEPSGAPRARRDVSEINPSWSMPPRKPR